MSEEPKKLSEITLDTEALPKALQEKFAGKSVEDVLKSYEEAQTALHEKSEEAKRKQEELEQLQSQPDPDPDPEPDPDLDQDDSYDDLYGDDTYVTKDLVDKRIEALNKKHEKDLQAVEDRAVNTALARIEKNNFIDGHPEIFEGKSPQEADAIIKKIAGAGYVNGKSTLEGSLESIKEVSDELGFGNTGDPHRQVPNDLPHKVIGEYDSPEDEISHMKKVHKETRGNISSFLK